MDKSESILRQSIANDQTIFNTNLRTSIPIRNFGIDGGPQGGIAFSRRRCERAVLRMNDTSPLIAVDGGATSTRVRLLEPATGRVLGEGSAGPSSLTLGVDQAWRNISAAVAVAADGLPLRAPRLFCGLAGGRSPTRRAEFHRTDPLGCAEIVVATDGYASLLGALAGAPGAVLAIGTGVAAFALDAGGGVRSASAWGFAVGDEGGGAWLGRRAVTCLTQWLDGRITTPSPLWDSLGAAIGDEFDAIQVWLAAAGATQFATLAPLVIDAARGGDAFALSLLDDATAELVRAVQAVAPDGPVALLGGLAPTFAPRFPLDLRARLIEPRGTALDGAALMARDGWREALAPLPPEEPRHDSP